MTIKKDYITQIKKILTPHYFSLIKLFLSIILGASAHRFSKTVRLWL